MSAKIEQIKVDGEYTLPVTNTKAVYDDAGNRLDNTLSGINESLTQITELDTVSINVSGINPSSSGFGVHKKNGICYITAYLVATSTSITFSGIPKPYSSVYGLVTETNNSTSTLFYIASNVDNFSLSNVTQGNTYVLNVSYPHK